MGTAHQTATSDLRVSMPGHCLMLLLRKMQFLSPLQFICVLFLLTTNDITSQILSQWCGTEKYPFQIEKSELSWNKPFPQKLAAQRTTARRSVALIVLIFAIHHPLTYQVVVLRQFKTILLYPAQEQPSKDDKLHNCKHDVLSDFSFLSAL